MKLRYVTLGLFLCVALYAEQDELNHAYAIRVDAAQTQTLDYENRLPSLIPSDDSAIPFYAGSFTKLLEHDPRTGLLTREGQRNYEQLLQALATGEQEDFNAIERAKGAKRLYLNPQAAFGSNLVGAEKITVYLPPPPALSSAHAAADLIELYCMELCRDVLCSEYGTGKGSDDDGRGGSLSGAAATILAHLPAYKGPRKNGKVDNAVLFRGTTRGDLIGPYMSQFLLYPMGPLFPVGDTDVDAEQLPQSVVTKKRCLPILQKREFGVSWQDFIALQNGHIPKKFIRSDYDPQDVRCPITGRDLACFVYTDVAYDAYYNALQVLSGRNFPYSKAFPYQKSIAKNERSGPTMGLPDVYSLIGAVCLQAYNICWFYKWRMYRRLRPDAMSGLVHQIMITEQNPFHLHETLFDVYQDIDLLELVLKHNQKQSDPKIDPTKSLTKDQASTYLLSQIYPESCPAHPSYPAAHATVAGACSTILKAFFDENTLIKSKMQPMIVDHAKPSELKPLTSSSGQIMTVGGELDKLASNVSYARSWAGIHFRSDNEAGLHLGQEIAIRLLQDHARTYHEPGFKGFTLTKRDGTRILITLNRVVELKQRVPAPKSKKAV